MREDGQRTCFMLGRTPGLSRIIVYDDMEGQGRWKGDGLLPVGIISKSQTHVYGGDWALKAGREVYTPNGIVWRDYYRMLQGSHAYVVFVGVRFYSPTLGGGEGAGVGFWVRSDSVDRRWGVRYVLDSGLMQYYTSRARWGYHLAATCKMGRDCWHELGFQVDIRSQSYGLLLCDGNVFDLSSLEGYEAHYPSADESSGRVWVGNSKGGTAYVWFDDFRVIGV